MSSPREPVRLALTATGPLVTIDVARGDEACLAFRHSIYGSWVEETFRVAADGLRLARLRYAEPRLVEFYGHEAARRDGAWWVVDGDGRLHPTLTVRATAESCMQLSAGGVTVRLQDHVGPGEAVRIAVVAPSGRTE